MTIIEGIARDTWASLSTPERNALAALAAPGAAGRNYRANRVSLGLATILIRRGLAEGVEDRIRLTERGKFVLKHGSSKE